MSKTKFLILFGTWVVFKSLVDVTRHPWEHFTLFLLEMHLKSTDRSMILFLSHKLALIGMQFAFWFLSQLHPLLFKSQCQKEGNTNEIHYIAEYDGLLSQPGTWCVHLKTVCCHLECVLFCVLDVISLVYYNRHSSLFLFSTPPDFYTYLSCVYCRLWCILVYQTVKCCFPFLVHLTDVFEEC